MPHEAFVEAFFSSSKCLAQTQTCSPSFGFVKLNLCGRSLSRSFERKLNTKVNMHACALILRRKDKEDHFLFLQGELTNFEGQKSLRVHISNVRFWKSEHM